MLVTLNLWRVRKEERTPVTLNPLEVSEVVDYCGSIDPGQMITMRNKKVYLVCGTHADVIAKLNLPLPFSGLDASETE
jgi:hypothetical protein